MSGNIQNGYFILCLQKYNRIVLRPFAAKQRRPMTDANIDVFLIKLHWCINGGGTEDGDEKGSPSLVYDGGKSTNWMIWKKTNALKVQQSVIWAPILPPLTKARITICFPVSTRKNPDFREERAGYCTSGFLLSKPYSYSWCLLPALPPRKEVAILLPQDDCQQPNPERASVDKKVSFCNFPTTFARELILINLLGISQSQTLLLSRC